MSVALGKHWAAILFCTGLLAACSSPPPPPPPPTMVELTFTAAADVNPDGSGRPSPIIVRYYQLAGTAAFDKADYFQLYNHEPALLGADLLAKEEVPLAPGATQKASFEAKPGTKFLGVIASYYNIDQAVWRGEVAIPPNKTTKLKIQLDKLKLSIAPDAG